MWGPEEAGLIGEVLCGFCISGKRDSIWHKHSLLGLEEAGLIGEVYFVAFAFQEKSAYIYS